MLTDFDQCHKITLSKVCCLKNGRDHRYWWSNKTILALEPCEIKKNKKINGKDSEYTVKALRGDLSCTIRVYRKDRNRPYPKTV